MGKSEPAQSHENSNFLIRRLPVSNHKQISVKKVLIFSEKYMRSGGNLSIQTIPVRFSLNSHRRFCI